MDSLSLASRDRGLSLDSMAIQEDGYMTDSTMFTIHDDDVNIDVSMSSRRISSVFMINYLKCDKSFLLIIIHASNTPGVNHGLN